MTVGERVFSNYAVLTESLTVGLALKFEYRSFLNWWENNHQRFENLPFNIDRQISLFLDTARKKGIDTAFSQLRMDVYGYYLEYIRQESVLPFTLRFDKNGQLIGDFYGDKPLTAMINCDEREGALSKGIIDLEKKLKLLFPGEMILRISPSGWTGLGYDFKETQIQIFWREKDKIRGLTLRSNSDLNKIILMLQSLGINLPDNLSEDKEKIKWIVGQNIVLPDGFSIEDLIKNYFPFDHKGRSLIKQYQRWLSYDSDFVHYEEIREVVDFMENMIKKLINEGKNDEEIAEELRRLLGFALMTMMGNQMKDDRVISFYKRDYFSAEFSSDMVFLPPPFYDRIIDRLQSLPGCAGFGLRSFSSSRALIMNPFGIVEVDNVGISSDKVLQCVTCPFCGKTVDAEIITKADSQYIHCPKCGGEVRKN